MKRTLRLTKDLVTDLTPAELDGVGGGHKIELHSIPTCFVTAVTALVADFSRPATECFTSCWQDD